MLKHIASVGGLTLASRAVGFVRDLALANILGAGPLADAFFVAFRLPNHFRAIFAEGAFNAAFVPTFTRVDAQKGRDVALLFADRIFMLLLLSQLVLLIVALGGMPWLVTLLAPGLKGDPVRFPLAVELTRITFPYLAFIAMMVLVGGVLNGIGRFAAAAGAAILLNVAMIVALLLSGFFPTSAHAAAVGVVVSGVLQFLLVAIDALRSGTMIELRWPKLDVDVRAFWKAFLPATAGSAGFQLAVFADTIIASFLPAGVISALYYADRVNQLPVGVIGIAVGTVLLSEMSKRVASGDEAGARTAQMRAIELTLLFTAPCIAAFLILPDVIIRSLFLHGAFTAHDARVAAEALAAYGVGLAAFMLLRAFTVTFHARGDTRTPVIAMMLAILVNIIVKIALMGPLQHVGLAIGTSVGAWVNIGLLVYLGRRAGYLGFDKRAMRTLPRLGLAFAILSAALLVATIGTRFLAGAESAHGDRLRLIILVAVGAVVYGGALAALFGRQVLDDIRKMRRGAQP